MTVGNIYLMYNIMYAHAFKRRTKTHNIE